MVYSQTRSIERMSDMNISGVTSTAQTMGVSSVNMRSLASIQVMDLAQSAFQDAAEQLIATMSSMTGVGQNVDMYV